MRKRALATAVMVAGLGCCGGALAASPTVPIHKCREGDRYIYQQEACHGEGVTGTMVAPDITGELVPLPVPPPRPARSASAAVAAASEAPPAAAPAVPKLPVPADPRLERLADACLAWYKPLVREPETASRSSPRKEGGTLFMLVNSADGRGGFASRAAACEFGADGSLDARATEVHAQRRGWALKPAP